ncbi:MAG: hypothetical protein RL172_1830 [Bacteroidota bacterium]|jgi:hypothetical protein
MWLLLATDTNSGPAFDVNTRIMKKKKWLFILCLFPAIAIGQLSKKDSLWLPMQLFIGEWAGTGGGAPGTGNYTRSYEFMFNKNFIAVKNKSTYPPGANDTQSEVHEDIGYFSYDKRIKKFKLRQFHIEGFVNEFVLDSISADKKTIVFVTESIENIPVGFRAKETYRWISNDELEETFELAEPGKPFEIYTRTTLTRRR